MSPAMIVLVAVSAVIALFVLRALLVGYPPKSVPDGMLTAREQALIAAAADAFFPPRGPIPISGTEAGLVAYIDEYVRDSPGQLRALTRLLFAFLEFGPWIFGPLRSRFTQLSAEDRIDVLGGMATSPIYFRRIAFLSMRTLLSMGYFANDAVSARIGCSPCLAPFERKAPDVAAETEALA